MSAPALLFVPASGAQGSGEYYRSLAIARAAQARWPAARICFIVNSAAGYARQCPFETVLVEGSPTYNTAAVNATIDRMKPDIVVFDSAGRVGQLAHARRRHAATVYVSSRFKTRWKGFRVRCATMASPRGRSSFSDRLSSTASGAVFTFTSPVLAWSPAVGGDR